MNSTKKILIVEDDLEMCKTLKDIFAEKGFCPEVAHTGNMAIEIVKKSTFRAMLVDLNIPDTNGIEVIKKVHISNEEILIYAMTASLEEDMSQEVLKNGAIKLFKKPFDLDEVINIIGNP